MTKESIKRVLLDNTVLSDGKMNDVTDKLYALFQDAKEKIASDAWDARDDYEGWTSAPDKQAYLESLKQVK